MYGRSPSDCIGNAGNNLLFTALFRPCAGKGRLERCEIADT